MATADPTTGSVGCATRMATRSWSPAPTAPRTAPGVPALICSRKLRLHKFLHELNPLSQTDASPRTQCLIPPECVIPNSGAFEPVEESRAERPRTKLHLAIPLSAARSLASAKENRVRFGVI